MSVARFDWNKRVQRALNAFLARYKIPFPVVRVDGQLGPGTKAAIKEAKYLLGYTRPYQVWATGTNDVFLRRLAHPSYRMTPAAIVRGISRRRQAVRINLGTVEGCAKWVLKSPNVVFWDGLSTGSERVKFQQLARSGRAYCNHTGNFHAVKLNLMQGIVAMGKSTPSMLNALNGGDHPYEDSNPGDPRHYANPCKAVDMDLSRGSTGLRVLAAGHHGLQRNSESSHEHYDAQ